ncbi:MAG: hypothetical protein WD649_06095 [Thermoleophilaceae bacterium]
MRATWVYVALACAALPALLAPAAAEAQAGGATYVAPPPPAKRAKLWHGKAIPPRNAPRRVKAAIRYGNRIARKPYLWGGGHGVMSRTSTDRGYDCSGTISYALFGGRFLKTPRDSVGFFTWGKRGKGRWITVYANGGHAYIVIAGLRLDTSRGSSREPTSGRGPRWRKFRRVSSSFRARHPRGY